MLPVKHSPLAWRHWLWIITGCFLAGIVSTGFIISPAPVADPAGSNGLNLPQRLACFKPLEQSAVYRVSLCADLPVNDKPDKLYYKKETGHVFLILEKSYPDTTYKKITQVFGFYPRRPVSSIVFKNVKCEILDNSEREYNAAISLEVSAAAFGIVLQQATALAAKKYNINKYNCYDYALEVFNALPGIEQLPVRHIRFPFPFGRGGTPCALYRDLEKLKANGSVWAPWICFGVFTSPSSTPNP